MNCIQHILKSVFQTTLMIALALPASVFASSERAKISQQQLSVEITETLQEYRKHKTFGELQKFISARVSANAMKEVERRIGKNQSGRTPAAKQEGDTIVFVNTEVPVTLRIVDPDKHVVEVNHTLVTLTDDFVKDMRNLEAALPRTHSSFFNFHLINEAQAQADPVTLTFMAGVVVVAVVAEIWNHIHTKKQAEQAIAFCNNLKNRIKNAKKGEVVYKCEETQLVLGDADDAVDFCGDGKNRKGKSWVSCNYSVEIGDCKEFLTSLCVYDRNQPDKRFGVPTAQPAR